MHDRQPLAARAAPDPRSASPHGSQQRDDHREWIAGRVLTLLETFNTGDRDAHVEAAIAADWIAVLEPFPQDAIEAACLAYLAEGVYRPKPADIRSRAVAFLAANRPPPQPPKQIAAPERKPVDPERAQRILHEAGFTEAKMDLVRRFPAAQSMAYIAEIADKRQSAHWSDTAAPDGPEMAALRAARDANPLVQAARAAQREAMARSGE